MKKMSTAPQYPGLPADYIPKRLARLHKRGDVVRRYKEVATELYDSLISDIHSGRKRAAVAHFRAFADYCLNCLFVAYAASEDELNRTTLPTNLVEAFRRLLKHWRLPVADDHLRKLEKTYHDLSQAAHGTQQALKKLDRWAATQIAAIEEGCELLMDMVNQADLRLNGHRAR